MSLNLTYADVVDVFAVPGERTIIDGVHPVTGRSVINAETLDEIRQRYPGAVRMSWADWQADAASRQHTPVTWHPTTAAQYDDMRDVLPPAAWMADAFLVGEPADHCVATGAPRFEAYAKRGNHYVVASRPMTRREFKEEITRWFAASR